jgi:hypothetical protein
MSSSDPTFFLGIFITRTAANSTDLNVETRGVRYHSQERQMTLESMSDEEILHIANPIMDNLMDASTAIDHERHIRDFSERMKRLVTKEYLQKVCEKYQREKGYFSRREPVAVFKRPGAVAIIWKQWFTKAPGEFVAEMLLVEKDGTFLVDHAMVF